MSEPTNQLITQQAGVFSMQGFEHAQRVAKMLCSSNLIPKEFIGNIQNTMIALEMANRIGASPLAVMQNLYVVHGKPSWSSTFIIASINSCGRFKPLRFDKLGAEGSMDRSCIAWTVEKDVKIEPTIRTLDQARQANLPVIEGPKVTMKMAKEEGWIDKAGSKWKTMPELMIMYRSAAFFGRLYTPELLMGMKSEEETLDIDHTDITPAEEVKINKEAERMVLMIESAKTVEDLDKLKDYVQEPQMELFESRKKQLTVPV